MKMEYFYYYEDLMNKMYEAAVQYNKNFTKLIETKLQSNN
jgi:hypothetical protein